ncbi:MAG: GTP 3',8-cyclase MoaA [Chloroflexi bacterium]|nr:GTP 3',8-cyclase MoaA [Chloroflexota bacterium]
MSVPLPTIPADVAVTEPPATITDRLGRALHDLRVSVTDRCNFRCTYCMPREVFGPGYRFVPRADLLTFEEITRLARVFADLGARKIRLTGGEPLVRRDLPDLVRMLAGVPGIDDLAMTTNGSLLALHARALADAGLGRITVSLDSLDDAVFAQLNDVGMSVGRVVAGIEAAEAAGLGPIKIDAVVRRGVNEESIVPLALEGRRRGWIVRFIEYMDVGQTNGWRMEDVVPADEILDRIGRVLPFEPLSPAYPGEVATRFRYLDGDGELGIIASVTRPFCASCTRARLSAEGRLYLCLFGMRATDLRGPLRAGATDDDLRALVTGAWTRRTDRYSELRSDATVHLPRVEMSAIGG